MEAGADAAYSSLWLAYLISFTPHDHLPRGDTTSIVLGPSTPINVPQARLESSPVGHFLS